MGDKKTRLPLEAIEIEFKEGQGKKSLVPEAPTEVDYKIENRGAQKSADRTANNSVVISFRASPQQRDFLMLLDKHADKPHTDVLREMIDTLRERYGGKLLEMEKINNVHIEVDSKK